MSNPRNQYWTFGVGLAADGPVQRVQEGVQEGQESPASARAHAGKRGKAGGGGGHRRIRRRSVGDGGESDPQQAEKRRRGGSKADPEEQGGEGDRVEGPEAPAPERERTRDDDAGGRTIEEPELPDETKAAPPQPKKQWESV